MKTVLQTRPIEPIVHRTGSLPFLLHHTIIQPGDSNALYLHCHPEAEFFFMAKGSLIFHVENHSFTLHAGDAMFIPPNLIHHAETLSIEDGCDFHATVFSLTLLEDILPGVSQTFFLPVHNRRMDCICPLYQVQEENAFLLSTLKTISSYKEKSTTSYELALPGALLTCWQELFNLHFSKLNLDESSQNLSTDLQKNLAHILDYMQLHYQEQLSLADLAREIGLSEGYFCRSFKNFTGLSPFEYLNRIRIIKSCEHLSQTNKKITDIASLTGFNNISYFNRMFYKIMDTTPSNYRKNL